MFLSRVCIAESKMNLRLWAILLLCAIAIACGGAEWESENWRLILLTCPKPLKARPDKVPQFIDQRGKIVAGSTTKALEEATRPRKSEHATVDLTDSSRQEAAARRRYLAARQSKPSSTAPTEAARLQRRQDECNPRPHDVVVAIGPKRNEEKPPSIRRYGAYSPYPPAAYRCNGKSP
jgi:hypothetical protein